MPATDIAEFKEWLMTVAPNDLERWLLDAYWHEQLEDTELRRAYLLSKKGVDIRTQPLRV